MSMPLWIFSDNTLAAMLTDANMVETDPELKDRDEILTQAEAKIIADEIRGELRKRNVDWQLLPDGSIAPEVSGTA